MALSHVSAWLGVYRVRACVRCVSLLGRLARMEGDDYVLGMQCQPW